MADDPKELALRGALAQSISVGGRTATVDVVWTEVHDMSPETAQAHVQIATQTHAVPAKEKTKQVGIETVGRVVLGGGLAVGACLLLTGGPLASVLIAIAAIFGGKPLIEALRKRSE